MARIVLSTFGSFGDLHPYIAIAIELQRRGHECVVATSEIYRQKICGEGLGFAQVRPDVGELLNEPERLEKFWHARTGIRTLLRDYLLAQVEQSFSDLDRACVGADLLLTHAVAYAGPVVAAVRKLRWLSVVLQPALFFSRQEPAVLAAAPWTRHLGRAVFGALMNIGNKQTRGWAKPVFALRKRLGISDDSNPVMEGQFSPFGTLTLFSEAFAQAQSDWPPNSKPTGFVFYDKRGEIPGLDPARGVGLSESLQRFLASGEAPVLFTLGSSAVMNAGNFYTASAEAAKQLGLRAVLLAGNESVPADRLIHVEAYASYSALMPHVSAVVHQGGIGTSAQTMRAGKPMLVVPFANDQPDNAYRLEGMGVARALPRGRYRASSAAHELRALFNNTKYAQQAEALSRRLQTEDGLSAACDRIEAVIC